MTIRDLHEQYISYQTAFNKLTVEISRRQHYKDAAENIVKGMMSQLTAMTEGESNMVSLFVTSLTYVVYFQKRIKYVAVSMPNMAPTCQKIFAFVSAILRLGGK